MCVYVIMVDKKNTLTGHFIGYIRFNCLSLQISNHPMTLQQFSAFSHIGMTWHNEVQNVVQRLFNDFEHGLAVATGQTSITETADLLSRPSCTTFGEHDWKKEGKKHSNWSSLSEKALLNPRFREEWPLGVAVAQKVEQLGGCWFDSLEPCSCSWCICVKMLDRKYLKKVLVWMNRVYCIKCF